MKYQDPSLTPAQRAADLLPRLSLREKVGQLNQRLTGFACYQVERGRVRLSQELIDEVQRFHGLGCLYGLYRADPWSRRDFSNGLAGPLMKQAYNAVQRLVLEHSPHRIPMLMSSECPHGHQALNGYLLPVNFNSLSQTVIAGEVEAAQAAANRLAGMGAKAVKLAVSSAFHSRMMAPAAEEFRAAIADVKTNPLSKPFYSNLNAKPLDPDTDLVEYLATHLISPVRFHEEVSAMLSDGIERFVELGPNKVLTMLVKRGFKQASAMNVENLKTLEKPKGSL